MSATYRPVSWTWSKLVYDLVLIAAVVVYVLAFLRLAPMLHDGTRPIDYPVLRMRAFGTCAFLMLTVVLSIGPLARLDRRFLPLLYNRRHFGVMTCAVALLHVDAVLDWYYAFSPLDPYVALLTSNARVDRLLGFPFELAGLAALAVLVVLAATSHDFWLSFLTPPVWKAIHMAVYGAYGLIVVHLALGPLQARDNPVLAMVATASVLTVGSLHWTAGRRERRRDRRVLPPAAEPPWLDAGPVDGFLLDRGRVAVLPDGERIAIFRHAGGLSAVSNVCAHQNGPLGEGRILDGCITCPWHGFQYRPEDGCAPPPYTEKIATYRLKRSGDRLLVDPRPNPPGTPVAPVPAEPSPAEAASP